MKKLLFILTFFAQIYSMNRATKATGKMYKQLGLISNRAFKASSRLLPKPNNLQEQSNQNNHEYDNSNKKNCKVDQNDKLKQYNEEIEKEQEYMSTNWLLEQFTHFYTDYRFYKKQQ